MAVQITEPLFFERVLKEKIWGGRRFESIFRWQLPGEKKIGESWELSDVPGQESLVRNGFYAGRSFRELMSKFGLEILGLAQPAFEGRFPLLLKFLDTTEPLSVQVHPDDALAKQWKEREGGKTEAWYFLEVEEQSNLTVGVKPGTDSKKLAQALQSSNALECLESVSVQNGEALFIPAGLVHAIGAGFTLAEVQQTSDITYRLYDWNRLGDDGKPRSLHLEKGLSATNYSFAAPSPQRPRWRRPTRSFREGLLVNCAQFKMSLGEIEDEVEIRSPRRPVLLMVTEGHGEIGWGALHTSALDPGDTVLIPASIERYRLAPNEGKLFTLMIEPGPF